MRRVAMAALLLGLLGASRPGGPDAGSPPAKRQLAGRYALELVTRPAEPHAGELVELEVTVVATRPSASLEADPGEPVPDADLVVTFSGPRSPAQVRRLHPLEQPGHYGAHVTPTEPGTHAVQVARRSGKPGMDAAFSLVVSPSAPLHAIVVSAAGDGGSEPLAPLMRSLGDGLLALDAELAESRPERPEAEALARAMVALSRRVPGHGAHGNDGGFDAEAQALTRSLDQLATAPSRAKLADVEQNRCLRCHAAYRWGLTRDVSGWPSLSARDGGR